MAKWYQVDAILKKGLWMASYNILLNGQGT